MISKTLQKSSNSLDGHQSEEDILKEILTALPTVWGPVGYLTSKDEVNLEKDDSGFDDSSNSSSQTSLNSSTGIFTSVNSRLNVFPSLYDGIFDVLSKTT